MNDFGDAAALTDRDALAEFIGRANRPNLSPGGRLAETDSWYWLADALLESDWLAGYVTTARAAAWTEGNDHGIFTYGEQGPNPYEGTT